MEHRINPIIVVASIEKNKNVGTVNCILCRLSCHHTYGSIYPEQTKDQFNEMEHYSRNVSFSVTNILTSNKYW